MATIKSYTDIEQSRKLAEILPRESADMNYAYYHNPISGASYYEEYPIFHIPMNKNKALPCWSLTALLGVIPNSSLHKTFSGWRCDSYNKEGMSCILGEPSDNPIDACVAMIERLHELKLNH